MVTELIRRPTFATEAGTRHFARRHTEGRVENAFHQHGRLHLSRLGAGTYLGQPDEGTDRRYVEALLEAVRCGINVIDTATSYRQGRAEAVVGQALRILLEGGEIYRSEVLVSSKVGFVTPSPDAPDVLSGLRAVTVDADLCEPEELSCLCHCMAPGFVRASLERSLKRLGVQTIDVYFVHNPESQLLERDRAEVIERLRQAFEALEAAADEGLIRAYGVATWSGLRARPEERDYLSLEEIVGLAEEIAGTRHRCRAVQMPLNTQMPEACAYANQQIKGRWMSAIEAAQALELVTFVSAPLMQGKLLDDKASSSEEALQFARSVPGVASALVGMSRIKHVRDNATVARRALWGAERLGICGAKEQPKEPKSRS